MHLLVHLGRINGTFQPVGSRSKTRDPSSAFQASSGRMITRKAAAVTEAPQPHFTGLLLGCTCHVHPAWCKPRHKESSTPSSFRLLTSLGSCREGVHGSACQSSRRHYSTVMLRHKRQNYCRTGARERKLVCCLGCICFLICLDLSYDLSYDLS